MTKPLLLALALVAAIAAPARADVRGDMSLAVGAQAYPTQGLVGQVDFFTRLENLELDARLAAKPTAPLDFFTGDVEFKLAPDLTGMLPIDVRPIAGLEGGMYIDEIAKPAGGTGTANAYVAAPLGARVALGLGGFAVQVEGLYHYELFQLLPVQNGYSVGRLHLEAAAKLGGLFGAVYYETGKLWSGPGAKIGLGF